MATPQALNALRRANEIRLERTRVRREVTENPRLAFEIISDPPEAMQGATVMYLLTGIPRLGEKRVTQVCAEVQVSPRRKLGDLTNQQRLRLAARLRDFGRLRAA